MIINQWKVKTFFTGDNMKTIIYVLMLSCLVYVELSIAETTEVDAEFYGSVRIGLDYVDAGTPDDAINGRDFLSRIGVKAENVIGKDIIGIVVLEYGIRNDNFVDVDQNDGLGRRLTYVGMRTPLGDIYYGSQNLIVHSFVRSSYFSDFNDTLRQATIRDDDLLQYFYTSKNWKLAAGAQFKGQDGDSVDQLQLGGEYAYGRSKYQIAYVKDNQGENKGDFIGVKFWWDITKKITFSSYYHFATHDFDIYAGATTGNVRLRDGETEGNVNGTRTCPSEERTSTGLYGRYRLGNHTIHGRLANDSCDETGDIDSVKIEYAYQVYKNFRTWIAAETLNNDNDRAPLSSSGDSMSVLQAGVRYDF